MKTQYLSDYTAVSSKRTVITEAGAVQVITFPVLSMMFDT